MGKYFASHFISAKELHVTTISIKVAAANFDLKLIKRGVFHFGIFESRIKRFSLAYLASIANFSG